jgi:hypothetical protein
LSPFCPRLGRRRDCREGQGRPVTTGDLASIRRSFLPERQLDQSASRPTEGKQR